ncbi:LON peptidase substrate-binding domain-containing protein [Escherichia coli]
MCRAGRSIRCLEAAMDHDKKIMLVAQKEASTDEPGVNDLFTVGTVALYIADAETA